MPAVPASADAAPGLTSAAAADRLRADGPNAIDRHEGTPAWLTFLRQFNSPVIWLLVVACAAAAGLGEAADAAAIATIVFLNGVVGFVQEHRAERAILALRSMTAPHARVRRDGETAVIRAVDVVRGDILLLEAGDVVPADAWLAAAHAFSTNEAALTGESAPVRKTLEASTRETPLAERRDGVFMGTSVATGTAVAEVTATGMRTELGRIAHLLATVEDEATPLQRRLAALSRMLLTLCLGIVAVVAAAGWLHGWPLVDVLLSAVSLAVAAVPEGLPAIVTIALAVGVQRMAARQVLVRRLPAVETLGCATVICTDKTGTLTTGAMRVRETWADDAGRLLFAAAACCDAELAEGAGRESIGDPTELAILIAAAERGIARATIERERPRIRVHPFDPVRRRMAIARTDGVLYVKGAMEAVLPLCVDPTPEAAEVGGRMASRGLRVLAVATGATLDEADLTFVGLVGIADPPRPEAIAAVEAARLAGITTVMITGDHPQTAGAIARELGILTPADDPAVVVHARATPEQKLEIVRAWKARGAIVAMTGDGVNDAPALREAHIGVAMGRTGTEVTREASDIVLADDNFASIVAGVREGRGIFDNIRKTLVYLLTGNVGELAIMLVSALAGLPLPLLPIQLLWINIVTDGLPALALAMDPTRDDVLRRQPRSPAEPMLGAREWTAIGAVGLLEGGLTLATFVWALSARDLTEARSLAFSVLVFAQVFRAFAARSRQHTLWEVGALSNLRLLAVVFVSAAVQLGIQRLPVMQELFGIGPLSVADSALTVVAGLCPVTVIELHKLARRGIARRRVRP